MNGNRVIRIMVVAVFALTASLPGAAQAPPAAPGIPAAPSPIGDISGLTKDAEGWLADLIRINTSNPPGNEEAAAKYVAGVLEKEGIKPELLELTPGRSAVVARLRSAAVADPSKALLLVAHLDVVPVEKSHWTVDPFAGVIKDGYLYGRGAIDDKGMLAANLAAFIALKRSAARLTRDV
ncbi:MAG TPA: M20/M25/M40 family metallo-hydrolase, partial [Candidatus Acidoferrum sp.]|nr:M20/M25/M40 family metallo-hydrolase [Candidatus Acidoferrum sp.]